MKAATQQTNPTVGWLVFLLIALAGLFYVKWFPYYNRAFVAAANHSIGPSILMGTATRPPAPSLDAAVTYALAYSKAIWQAMVLGLLLGSGVQALLRSNGSQGCWARLDSAASPKAVYWQFQG
jgi:hypothetical protein